MTSIELATAAEIRKYHGDALEVLDTLHTYVSRGYIALIGAHNPSACHLARAIEILAGLQRVHETALRELKGE